MSLAVQPTTDIKILTGAAQAEDTEMLDVSGESGEFSSVMEELSTECSGECSTGSDNPNDQTNSQQGGTSHPGGGKSDHPDGEKLPHDRVLSESELTEVPQDIVTTIDGVTESADPVDLIDRIYNSAEPDIDPKSPSVENPDTSEPRLKPNLEFGRDFLVQADADTGETQIAGIAGIDSPAAALTANAGEESDLAALPPVLEADSRRIAQGGIKENLSSAALAGATAGAANSGTEISSTQDSQARGLNGIILPVQSAKQGESITAEGLEMQQNLQKPGRSPEGAELPKKVDMEALLKDWAPTAAREGNSTSALSAGTQTSPIAGLMSASGVSQNPTMPGQTSNVAGSAQLLSLSTPVSDQAWADDFAVRIRTLVSGNVQQATLNLKPAELGAIEVSLSTDGNETKAQFMVQNAVVREVLESSMPRLREIFQDSGLSLTDADVHDQSLSQERGDQDQGESGSLARSVDRTQEDDGSTKNAEPILTRWDGDQLVGGVDTFI